MKRIVLALFVMALAIAGAQLVHIQNHESGLASLEIGVADAVAIDKELCGTSACTKVDIQSSDGAIGSTSNAATVVGTCRLINPVASQTAYWALRRYASVATGAVQAPHYYPVSTTIPVEVEINTRYPNGVYGDAVTGTVISRCGYTK
jgi:hypothetical protein